MFDKQANISTDKIVLNLKSDHHVQCETLYCINVKKDEGMAIIVR